MTAVERDCPKLFSDPGIATDRPALFSQVPIEFVEFLEKYRNYLPTGELPYYVEMASFGSTPACDILLGPSSPLGEHADLILETCKVEWDDGESVGKSGWLVYEVSDVASIDSGGFIQRILEIKGIDPNLISGTTIDDFKNKYFQGEKGLRFRINDGLVGIHSVLGVSDTTLDIDTVIVNAYFSTIVDNQKLSQAVQEEHKIMDSKGERMLSAFVVALLGVGGVSLALWFIRKRLDKFRGIGTDYQKSLAKRVPTSNELASPSEVIGTVVVEKTFLKFDGYPVDDINKLDEIKNEYIAAHRKRQSRR